MRHTASFPITDLLFLKQQILSWAAAQEVAVYLDSNAAAGSGQITAAGIADALRLPAGAAFPALQAFYEEKHDWLFGFLGYDLKNEVEHLTSQNFNGLDFPDLYFFQPEVVVEVGEKEARVHSLGKAPELVWADILNVKPQNNRPISCDNSKTSQVDCQKQGPIWLTPRLPKPDYLATVARIREHIIEGDLYEMNLCQEFYAEDTVIDPHAVFQRLNARAQAPFSAFFKLDNQYLLCASPERFLKKEGNKLTSQPIKGTRRRHPDPAEDERIRQELAVSEKDRAENVMIVDLVRNDLARHCLPGSVRVEELFGIYTFSTVHQMISTISGLLPNDHKEKGKAQLADSFQAMAGQEMMSDAPIIHQPTNQFAALRDAFPPGSMTGAPKVMAMRLIEQYERTRRGLYSGALGYFTPAGDFDFNVVIRSILYHAGWRYVSVQVGGAIVFDSVPEEEYEECLVKAEAMLRALQDEIHQDFPTLRNGGSD